jgi:uncharacterized protein YbjQ (UPF0145 family)
VIVTTTYEVAGQAIGDYLGIVRGIVVRVPTRRQRIRGSYQATFEGGNIGEFVEVCDAARREAYEEMLKHAEELGADAIITVRYQATPFAGARATEVLAYGTAVRLVPLSSGCPVG